MLQVCDQTTASRSDGRPGRGKLKPLLIWRSLKWRAGSSAMFLVVAVAAIMAATAGPIYLRAADQSLVSAALGQAPPVDTGVTLSAAPNRSVTPAQLLAAAATVPGGEGASGSDRYGAPILTIDMTATLDLAATQSIGRIDFVSRTGVCAHLHLVSGTCPTAPGQVAISSRTAQAIGVHVGGLLHPIVTKGTPSTSAKSSPKTKILRVSALYMLPNPSAPYWWDGIFFPFGTGSPTVPRFDDGFMTVAGATALASSIAASDYVQLPLRTTTVDSSSIPMLVGSLNKWQSRLQSSASSSARSSSIVAATLLPTVIGQAESEEHFARTIVALISLQLVLLALLVLYAVTRATSVMREPDVRVAQLRGLPRRRIARLALREPFVLLVVALPIGVGLTYILLSVVDRHVLGPSASTRVDSLALGAALTGGAAGLVSATIASRSLFTLRGEVGSNGASGSASSSSTAAKQRRSRHAALLDAFGLALAAAGVAALIGQSGHSQATVGPVSYVGPGLVALGAAILAARLLPFAAGLVVRVSTWSRAVAITLASRQLARSATLARQVLIPVIATGLLVFGVAGLAVAGRNHATQAEFSMGDSGRAACRDRARREPADGSPSGGSERYRSHGGRRDQGLGRDDARRRQLAYGCHRLVAEGPVARLRTNGRPPDEPEGPARASGGAR